MNAMDTPRCTSSESHVLTVLCLNICRKGLTCLGPSRLLVGMPSGLWSVFAPTHARVLAAWFPAETTVSQRLLFQHYPTYTHLIPNISLTSPRQRRRDLVLPSSMQQRIRVDCEAVLKIQLAATRSICSLSSTPTLGSAPLLRSSSTAAVFPPSTAS